MRLESYEIPVEIRRPEMVVVKVKAEDYGKALAKAQALIETQEHVLLTASGMDLRESLVIDPDAYRWLDCQACDEVEAVTWRVNDVGELYNRTEDAAEAEWAETYAEIDEMNARLRTARERLDAAERMLVMEVIPHNNESDADEAEEGGDAA